jgi:NAD(P)H-flavin reductase
MSTPRKIRCIVEQVTNHGDRVYTVALKPERAVPAFLPGQFLHLTLDEYDPSGFWPESRVFSIASSPVDRSALALIYSVKGKYTARMEAELCVGKSVWVKLPYGEFVVDGRMDAILIAGGTGITAFQAFIEGLTPQHPNKVVLLYGARRPGLLLGREIIEGQARIVEVMKAFLFSEELEGRAPSRPLCIGHDRAWPSSKEGETGGVIPGRIRLDVLKDCPLSASAVYYLAGPPPMVFALTNELAQRGVSGHNVRVDSWE